MSNTQFTRADWRPGNRRKTYPRQRDFGGRKQAPAALIAAGLHAGLHTNTAARCTAIANSTGRKCRRVAVTGCSKCMCHGGALSLIAKRGYVKTQGGQERAAERILGDNRDKNII